ncbi:MAG TPA: SdiA-regulated domain-containing protein, partial [Candidatus Acidoferrum sp.]|nr:SdiA-regulated domain-containing protein [Candidatus Acidoferrum sp.]
MRTLLNNNRMLRRGALALRQHERHPRINLDRYALAQSVALTNITSDCSGVAYSPVTRTIFVIKNSTNFIYEYSVTGTWLRTVSTTGFTDCEGICWMYDDYFGISDEDTSSITIVRIQPATASLTKAGGTTVNTGLGNLDSTTGGGFEGVSYDPENHKFYV